MQAFSTSTAARIDREEEIGDPRAERAAPRAFRRIEPDPFVHFLGVIVLRSALVRAGIVLLD